MRFIKKQRAKEIWDKEMGAALLEAFGSCEHTWRILLTLEDDGLRFSELGLSELTGYSRSTIRYWKNKLGIVEK